MPHGVVSLRRVTPLREQQPTGQSPTEGGGSSSDTASVTHAGGRGVIQPHSQHSLLPSRSSAPAPAGSENSKRSARTQHALREAAVGGLHAAVANGSRPSPPQQLVSVMFNPPPSVHTTIDVAGGGGGGRSAYVHEPSATYYAHGDGAATADADGAADGALTEWRTQQPLSDDGTLPLPPSLPFSPLFALPDLPLDDRLTWTGRFRDPATQLAFNEFVLHDHFETFYRTIVAATASWLAATSLISANVCNVVTGELPWILFSTLGFIIVVGILGTVAIVSTVRRLHRHFDALPAAPARRRSSAGGGRAAEHPPLHSWQAAPHPYQQHASAQRAGHNSGHAPLWRRVLTGSAWRDWRHRKVQPRRDIPASLPTVAAFVRDRQPAVPSIITHLARRLQTCLVGVGVLQTMCSALAILLLYFLCLLPHMEANPLRTADTIPQAIAMHVLFSQLQVLLTLSIFLPLSPTFTFLLWLVTVFGMVSSTWELKLSPRHPATISMLCAFEIAILSVCERVSYMRLGLHRQLFLTFIGQQTPFAHAKEMAGARDLRLLCLQLTRTRKAVGSIAAFIWRSCFRWVWDSNMHDGGQFTAKSVLQATQGIASAVKCAPTYVWAPRASSPTLNTAAGGESCGSSTLIASASDALCTQLCFGVTSAWLGDCTCLMTHLHGCACRYGHPAAYECTLPPMGTARTEMHGGVMETAVPEVTMLIAWSVAWQCADPVSTGVAPGGDATAVTALAARSSVSPPLVPRLSMERVGQGDGGGGVNLASPTAAASSSVERIIFTESGPVAFSNDDVTFLPSSVAPPLAMFLPPRVLIGSRCMLESWTDVTKSSSCLHGAPRLTIGHELAAHQAAADDLPQAHDKKEDAMAMLPVATLLIDHVERGVRLSTCLRNSLSISYSIARGFVDAGRLLHTARTAHGYLCPSTILFNAARDDVALLLGGVSHFLISTLSFDALLDSKIMVIMQHFHAPPPPPPRDTAPTTDADGSRVFTTANAIAVSPEVLHPGPAASVMHTPARAVVPGAATPPQSPSFIMLPGAMASLPASAPRAVPTQAATSQPAYSLSAQRTNSLKSFWGGSTLYVSGANAAGMTAEAASTLLRQPAPAPSCEPVTSARTTLSSPAPPSPPLHVVGLGGTSFMGGGPGSGGTPSRPASALYLSVLCLPPRLKERLLCVDEEMTNAALDCSRARIATVVSIPDSTGGATQSCANRASTNAAAATSGTGIPLSTLNPGDAYERSMQVSEGAFTGAPAPAASRYAVSSVLAEGVRVGSEPPARHTAVYAPAMCSTMRAALRAIVREHGPATDADDVYAFGMVLWLMLCATNQVALLRHVLRGELTLRQLLQLTPDLQLITGAGIPMGALYLVRMCTESAPSNRPQWSYVNTVLHQLLFSPYDPAIPAPHASLGNGVPMRTCSTSTLTSVDASSLRMDRGAGSWAATVGAPLLPSSLLLLNVPINPALQQQYNVIAADELTVTSRLGGGSVGDVYHAWYRHTSVAVKVYDPDQARRGGGATSARAANKSLSRSALEFMMRREAGLLAMLRHENILQYIGVCVDPALLSLITAYMEGGTFSRLLYAQAAGSMQTTATVAPASALTRSRVQRDRVAGVLDVTSRDVAALAALTAGGTAVAGHSTSTHASAAAGTTAQAVSSKPAAAGKGSAHGQGGGCDAAPRASSGAAAMNVDDADGCASSVYGAHTASSVVGCGDAQLDDGGCGLDNALSSNAVQVARPALSLQARLRVLCDVARALAFLHSFAGGPVMHRDIKPSNVLLTPSMRGVLGDFGFARTPNAAHQLHTLRNMAHSNSRQKASAAAQMEEHLARAWMLSRCGSPMYTAPEILANLPVTEAIDVYSFGVMLAEVVSSKRPLQLLHEANVMAATTTTTTATTTGRMGAGAQAAAIAAAVGAVGADAAALYSGGGGTLKRNASIRTAPGRTTAGSAEYMPDRRLLGGGGGIISPITDSTAQYLDSLPPNPASTIMDSSQRQPVARSDAPATTTVSPRVATSNQQQAATALRQTRSMRSTRTIGASTPEPVVGKNTGSGGNASARRRAELPQLPDAQSVAFVSIDAAMMVDWEATTANHAYVTAWPPRGSNTAVQGDPCVTITPSPMDLVVSARSTSSHGLPVSKESGTDAAHDHHATLDASAHSGSAEHAALAGVDGQRGSAASVAPLLHDLTLPISPAAASAATLAQPSAATTARSIPAADAARFLTQAQFRCLCTKVLAELCLVYDPHARPKMSCVLRCLEGLVSDSIPGYMPTAVEQDAWLWVTQVVFDRAWAGDGPSNAHGGGASGGGARALGAASHHPPVFRSSSNTASMGGGAGSMRMTSPVASVVTGYSPMQHSRMLAPYPSAATTTSTMRTSSKSGITNAPLAVSTAGAGALLGTAASVADGKAIVNRLMYDALGHSSSRAAAKSLASGSAHTSPMPVLSASSRGLAPDASALPALPRLGAPAVISDTSALRYFFPHVMTLQRSALTSALPGAPSGLMSSRHSFAHATATTALGGGYEGDARAAASPARDLGGAGYSGGARLSSSPLSVHQHRLQSQRSGDAPEVGGAASRNTLFRRVSASAAVHVLGAAGGVAHSAASSPPRRSVSTLPNAAAVDVMRLRPSPLERSGDDNVSPRMKLAAFHAARPTSASAPAPTRRLYTLYSGHSEQAGQSSSAAASVDTDAQTTKRSTCGDSEADTVTRDATDTALSSPTTLTDVTAVACARPVSGTVPLDDLRARMVTTSGSNFVLEDPASPTLPNQVPSASAEAAYPLLSTAGYGSSIASNAGTGRAMSGPPLTADVTEEDEMGESTLLLSRPLKSAATGAPLRSSGGAGAGTLEEVVEESADPLAEFISSATSPPTALQRIHFQDSASKHMGPELAGFALTCRALLVSCMQSAVEEYGPGVMRYLMDENSDSRAMDAFRRVFTMNVEYRVKINPDDLTFDDLMLSDSVAKQIAWWLTFTQSAVPWSPDACVLAGYYMSRAVIAYQSKKGKLRSHRSSNSTDGGGGAAGDATTSMAMGLLRHGSSESASPQRRARGGLSSFGSSIEDSALSGSYSAPSSPVSASAAEADELRAYKPFPIPASTTAGAASDVPDAPSPLVAMGYGENILLRRVCDPIPEASVESSSATVWTAVSPHPSHRTATHSSASSTLVVSTHIPFASSTSRTGSPQADAGRARHRGAQSPDASSGAAAPMFPPLLCPATWQRVAFGCLLLAQRVVDVHTVTERSNIAAYAYALGLMPTTTRMSVTPKQGTDMVHRCVNSLTYALFALLRRHVTVDLPVFTNIRLEYEMSLRATFTELEINIPPPHATVARGIVANSRKLAQALDARTVQRLAKSRASSSSSHFIGTAASGSLSPRQYATRVGYASSGGGGGGGSSSAASGSGPSAATVDAVSVLASVHSRSMKGYSSQLRKASSARSSWMNEQPLDEEDSHDTSEGGTSSHAS